MHCATVCGCGWQLGAPSTLRLVGEKRAALYSMLRHIATRCNMLRQWKRKFKKNKEKEDRKKVAPYCQMAKGVAEWCRKLQCVPVDSCRLQRVVACCSVLCIVTKTAGKWQKCNLCFGQGLCGQRHGLAMNWVDRPRTSADERDVVCSPRCRDCVWAVQSLVVFFIDLSFLREQST